MGGDDWIPWNREKVEMNAKLANKQDWSHKLYLWNKLNESKNVSFGFFTPEVQYTACVAHRNVQ